MRLNTKAYFLEIGILILTAFVFSGCAKKIIVMEYDQSTNFLKYKLDEQINNGWHLEDKIIAKGGIFLIYNICSITNNDENAELFQFDLSKFYVKHNGKRYYHTPLKKEQFNKVRYNYEEEWAKAFKSEVQTAPDMKNIPPKLENILSVSWRFHIWIGDVVWLDEFKTKNFDLWYDNSANGESYHLIKRGHSPIYIPPNTMSYARKEHLAVECRASNL